MNVQNLSIATMFLVAAAIIQALSTTAVVWLTCRLARATDQYAKTAENLFRLNQDQFEREWRPDVRIADVQISAGQVNLRVANLAKPAALIKELRIGTGGRTRQGIQPQDVDSFPVTHLVAGGQISDAAKIHSELGQYRERYNSAPVPLSRSGLESAMNLALVYDSAGAEKQTQWFDCTVEFEDYTVTNVSRRE